MNTPSEMGQHVVHAPTEESQAESAVDRFENSYEPSKKKTKTVEDLLKENEGLFGENQRLKEQNEMLEQKKAKKSRTCSELRLQIKEMHRVDKTICTKYDNEIQSLKDQLKELDTSKCDQCRPGQ